MKEEDEETKKQKEGGKKRHKKKLKKDKCIKAQKTGIQKLSGISMRVNKKSEKKQIGAIWIMPW